MTIRRKLMMDDARFMAGLGTIKEINFDFFSAEDVVCFKIDRSVRQGMGSNEHS